jgi:hypothetical protein
VPDGFVRRDIRAGAEAMAQAIADAEAMAQATANAEAMAQAIVEAKAMVPAEAKTGTIQRPSALTQP